MYSNNDDQLCQGADDFLSGDARIPIATLKTSDATHIRYM